MPNPKNQLHSKLNINYENIIEEKREFTHMSDDSRKSDDKLLIFQAQI